MVEISVILPVYNAEKYLKECLNSLINQTFEDIEILCVNDGSKDNSLKILEKFEAIDERVKVFNQENSGVAKTRNNTLKKANGNYIYFMDSDDYLDLTALEKLYKNITNNDSDFCLMKANFVNQDNVKHEHQAFNLEKEFDDDVDYNNFVFRCTDIKSHVLNDLFAPWFKLYKKEFLFSDEDFVFPETRSYSDAPFHVKTMLKASRISFVPEFLYCYRYNSKSLVHNPANTKNFFKISEIIENYLHDNDYFETFKNEFYAFKITKLIYYIEFSDSQEYYDEAKRELMEISEFTQNVEARYVDKMNIVLESDNFKECNLEIKLYNAEKRVEHLQESYDSLKSSYINLKTNYHSLKYKYNNMKTNYLSLKSKYNNLKDVNKSLNDEIIEFKTSTSWKITEPLRKIRRRK